MARRRRARGVYSVLTAIVLWGFVALRLAQPIVLLKLGANVAGIVFIVASLHLLYVNTRLLPAHLTTAARGAVWAWLASRCSTAFLSRSCSVVCGADSAGPFMATPSAPRRVAVVQAGSTMFDTPQTLDRMQSHCEAVQQSGAELAVFPEAYVGGYPKGLDFGARVGSRTPGRA